MENQSKTSVEQICNQTSFYMLPNDLHSPLYLHYMSLNLQESWGYSPLHRNSQVYSVSVSSRRSVGCSTLLSQLKCQCNHFNSHSLCPFLGNLCCFLLFLNLDMGIKISQADRALLCLCEKNISLFFTFLFF